MQYTPARKIDFTSGRATIFHEENRSNKLRYTPWEIKETTFKNMLGIFYFNMMDYFFQLNTLVYSLGCASFCINWVYRIYYYMGNAINKIELHDDGKTVTVTFKTGGT